MGDPYRIYFTPPERDSVARPSFPGYLSSETPSLLFNPTIPSTDTQRSYASDFLQRDIRSMTTGTGVYAVDDAGGLRFRHESVLGVTAGASPNGYSSLLEVPSLISQRHDVAAVSISPNVPADLSLERPTGSLRNADVLPVKGESNVLFVDGLPTDCTRREVSHIFRPFVGFKEIRVVHKEPRRSGDKAMVLCFVEFADPKCALTAMEALQGYKFDNKKPESPALKIHFAHFPFNLPDDDNEHRIRIPR
ncbi:RNA-binding protein 1 isoform X2 [Pyrus x bretschneideri]|uniref:RNA-binding protein 1 isoform X2 n=1 Tax=Pyrus x bretschneideri TaxID=225117 RepID=UPI00202E0F44|nr:RNA-binding protein 1 isoform X2 [Pyrus x bretschneideri]